MHAQHQSQDSARGCNRLRQPETSVRALTLLALNLLVPPNLCAQVVFNGKMVKLPCLPGKEGAELFKQQVSPCCRNAPTSSCLTCGTVS